MIERIEPMPSAVIGFKATGTVSAEDYKSVLIPEMEARLKEQGKLRLVYVMGPDFEGFEPGAMMDDTMFGLKHYFDFEKIAVVTDHDVWANAVKMMGWMIPGDVQVFSVGKLEDAKAWAAG